MPNIKSSERNVGRPSNDKENCNLKVNLKSTLEAGRGGWIYALLLLHAGLGAFDRLPLIVGGFEEDSFRVGKILQAGITVTLDKNHGRKKIS